MSYLILGLAAAAIIALLWLYGNLSSKSNLSGKADSKTAASFNLSSSKKAPDLQKKNLMQCTLCSSYLNSGENLFSKVYRPMNVPDQRCTISGCPHCYPKCESSVKRSCPVCKKSVPQKGYLVARLFNNTAHKKHVTIVGCTQCLKTFSKTN